MTLMLERRARERNLLSADCAPIIDEISNLGAAVIKQACSDWCDLYLAGGHSFYKYGSKIEDISELEKWFYSDDFIFWSEGRLDPGSILKQLKKNCLERKKGLYDDGEVRRMLDSQKKQSL